MLSSQYSLMDPSTAELNTLRSVFDACDWVGVGDELRDASSEQIGKKEPRLVRHVVAIKANSWNTAVAALGVAVGDGRRELSPVEEGQVGTLRRVCRLMLGLPGEEALLPQASAPEASVVCVPELTESRPVRKLKMTNVLEQADGSEISPLPTTWLLSSRLGLRLVDDNELPSVEQEATRGPTVGITCAVGSGTHSFRGCCGFGVRMVLGFFFT